MPIFRDEHGREWTVKVDVPALKRLREHDLDGVVNIFDEQMAGLVQLASDPIRLVDTLYVLCQKQAEQNSITDEQFGEALFGDALGSALDALCEAVVDFFRDPKRRETMRELLRKMREADGEMVALGSSEVAKIDVQALARQAVTPSSSATNSPDTSA